MGAGIFFSIEWGQRAAAAALLALASRLIRWIARDVVEYRAIYFPSSFCAAPNSCAVKQTLPSVKVDGRALLFTVRLQLHMLDVALSLTSIRSIFGLVSTRSQDSIRRIG